MAERLLDCRIYRRSNYERELQLHADPHDSETLGRVLRDEVHRLGYSEFASDFTMEVRLAGERPLECTVAL